ncbi:hypothetical protein EUGRSUZ_H04570 [Eucalyptus grandis]|uniref:Uncharacterized protein n=2 Tax=Eucalyptus grandis TaxID=71139 RepID=A0ACC3JX90_EUCGR|nr:hypothetical protein EUGRSUZ_H04570 [Eucalyptus grandis]
MEKYYRTFDANRADLVNLFREESVLDFEGQQIKGKEAILAKLTSILECRHDITDFNCLRHRTPGSMLVWVCGQTWVGGRRRYKPDVPSDANTRRRLLRRNTNLEAL